MMFPFGIGIAFYFRAFFRRVATTFGVDVSKKWMNIVAWCFGAVIGVLSLNMFSFTTIAILHLLALDAIFRLVNFIIRKSFGKKYTDGMGIWKKVYGSGAIPVLICLSLFIFGYYNIHNVVRTDYTVYTEKEIGDGYRVVMIADIHYGVSIDGEELREKCDEISRLNADIVVLGGDIVDNDTGKERMLEVFDILGDIESKYGVFYIYGNHDRLYGQGGAFTVDELRLEIESNGIKILQDDVVDIDECLTVVGREDRGYVGEGNRKSIEELLNGVEKDRFILTLDHQPNEYRENGKAGTDLLLSGHTHGGQFWPLNIVFDLFGINDAVYGKVQIDSDTTAIVTSGFAGWSFPVKTASPAEYVVIDIKQG